MSIRNNKVKDLTPLDVTFLQGESPTSEKLQGMMEQVRVALEYIENAVGDLYGEDENYKSWTSSLARDIGDRSLITPSIMPNQNIQSYAQQLNLGQVEHELDMLPIGSLSTLISSSLDSSVVPGQWKNSVSDLEVPGDWTVIPGYIENGRLKNSRKLVTHSPSDGGGIVFTEVTSGRGSSLEDSSENIIPSIAQAENGGPYLDVSVADSLTNTYLITLPLKEKMFDKTGQIVDFSASNTTLQVGQGSQAELPPWFFGADGLGLELDNTSGDPKAFPLNLIQLWDWNTKKRVEGIIEIKASPAQNARKFQFTMQMRADVILDDTNGAYLLTVPGNSISSQLNALSQAVYNNSGYGADMQRLIPHSSLVGLRTSSQNFSNRSEYYGPSNIDNNDHSQYLHRNGFVDSDNGAGGNVMRGDLVIGNSDLGPSDNEHEHYNVLNDSFKVHFGNRTDGGSLYYKKTGSHNIDHSYGGLPVAWNDNALVLEGSVSDFDPSKKHILLDGIVRTKGDVVLGESQNSTIFVQGKMYVNDELTLIPKSQSSVTGEEGKLIYDQNEKELLYYNGSSFSKPSQQAGYTVVVGDGANTFGKYNGTSYSVINSAITEASNLGGGTVKVLNGNYNFLTNKILIPQDVKIEGSGSRTIFSGTNVIAELSGEKSSITQLTLNGTGTADGLTVSSDNVLIDNLRIENCKKPINFLSGSIDGSVGANVEIVNCERAISGSPDVSGKSAMMQSAAFFPPFANSLFDWSQKEEVAREWRVSGGSASFIHNPGSSNSAIGKGNFEITGNGTIITDKFLPISPNLGVGAHICINCDSGADASVGMNLYDSNFNFIRTSWFLLDSQSLSTGSLVTQYFHNMAVGIGSGYERFDTNARFVKPTINISNNNGSVIWDLFDIQPLNFSRAATWG